MKKPIRLKIDGNADVTFNALDKNIDSQLNEVTKKTPL